MKKRIAVVAAAIVCTLLVGCSPNTPNDEFILELDALVDSTIGESDTTYDKAADEIVITQTAPAGSAYAITKRKNTIYDSWNNYLIAYRLMSETTYQDLQEDYTASCRVIIYSDEDPSFALYETVNGIDSYNAIEDASYAGYVVTESEAYDIATEKLAKDISRCYLYSKTESIRQKDKSVKETDEGYLFHLIGTARGEESGYGWNKSGWIDWDLTVLVKYNGNIDISTYKLKMVDVLGNSKTIEY